MGNIFSLKIICYSVLTASLLTASFLFCSWGNTEQKLQNVNLQIEEVSSKLLTSILNKSISQENLKKVTFTDEQNGWIISRSEIYKTKNAGLDWTRIKFEIPENSSVRDLFFINESRGWIVVQEINMKSDITKNEYHFTLFFTSDGGETWKEEYDENGCSIFEIHFVDEANGWIIGERYVKNPYNRLALVLKTTDGGRTWEDKSQEINKTLIQPYGGVNENVSSFYYDGKTKPYILTDERKVFSSLDYGDSFYFQMNLSFEKQQKVKIDNNEFMTDLSFSAFKIGLGAGNRLWIAGNLYSRSFHGAHVRGELSIENESNSWVNYIFDGFKIEDVKFLNDNKLVVCGSFDQENNSIGTLLYSADSGRTWNTIYRNKTDGNLSSVSVISKNKILAVGDKGKIISLEITE